MRRYSSEQIRAIRTKFDLTQEEFAPLLGLSVSALQNYEQGRRSISGPVCILLAIIDTNPPLIWDLHAAAGVAYAHPDEILEPIEDEL